MKIVVIGGTGLIGSQVVKLLTDHGHHAVAASPNTGVNTITGEGLAEALTDASAVVDVSNSPSLEGDAALAFFQKSTGNLLAAESAAGVGHHIALSVVGTDEMAEAGSGYMEAKRAQEELIAKSDVPYSIVHATQFFEFLKGITDAATEGDTVRLAPVFIRPMASADVAKAVAKASVGEPSNAVEEIGGPEEFQLDELVRRTLGSRNDPRTVLADPSARYFGAELGAHTLTPGGDATLYDTRLADWAARA
ncbi:SDR family oxidoreductase [Mycobacterium sp. NPDC051804]|uniref:SDR family oxidoreductase n=1 Tax=Mycobacterium sp. NPDC051804 TaxID=3364295 RepID=UPI0037B79A5A